MSSFFYTTFARVIISPLIPRLTDAFAVPDGAMVVLVRRE